jgi:signal transduction histidine kinase
VRDDGCGPHPDAQRAGMGVVGMHERFAQLGGRVTLFAAPEGGACLEARLPITHGAAA